jgi:exonuclease SbcD
VSDEIDAVVHAGDLFHDRHPDLEDLLGTLDVLRDLEKAGIPFLAIVGNHEGTRKGQWLDLFSRMGLATRLDDEGTVVGDTTFYGLDHVPVSQREALEYDFKPAETEHTALVTHGLFEPFGYADWDTEELLERASIEFDALLLGDNHHPDRAEVRDTWVTYCGSTERASAAEREDRGYNLVSFDGDVRISRKGLDTRTFVFADLDLAEGEGTERVLERVGQHELDSCVVIVRIEGEGEPVTPAEVESFARERGALIARVSDSREIEAASEFDVSFSDPDAAVKERLREMGLSRAASDIDGTVRASKIADSNVRAAVEERVRALIEEEPAAFETAEAGSPSGESELAVDEPEASSKAAARVSQPDSQNGSEAVSGDGAAEEGTEHGEATADTDNQSSMEEYS